MKKSLLIAMILMTGSVSAHAALTQTANVTTSVASEVALTMTIFELDNAGNPVGANLAPNMAFGELLKNGTDAQRSAKSFAVFLGATTSGQPYTVKANVPAITSATHTLPNALLMKVIQATQSGADISGDSFNGANQAGVMTNQTIYTSSPAGNTALINLVYGIHGGNPDGSAPFPGWVAVAPDQPAGNYSTTATYTLTVI
jgi:hypothetical protein